MRCLQIGKRLFGCGRPEGSVPDILKQGALWSLFFFFFFRFVVGQGNGIVALDGIELVPLQLGVGPTGDTGPDLGGTAVVFDVAQKGKDESPPVFQLKSKWYQSPCPGEH